MSCQTILVNYEKCDNCSRYKIPNERSHYCINRDILKMKGKFRYSGKEYCNDFAPKVIPLKSTEKIPTNESVITKCVSAATAAAELDKPPATTEYSPIKKFLLRKSTESPFDEIRRGIFPAPADELNGTSTYKKDAFEMLNIFRKFRKHRMIHRRHKCKCEGMFFQAIELNELHNSLNKLKNKSLRRRHSHKFAKKKNKNASRTESTMLFKVQKNPEKDPSSKVQQPPISTTKQLPPCLKSPANPKKLSPKQVLPLISLNESSKECKINSIPDRKSKSKSMNCLNMRDSIRKSQKTLDNQSQFPPIEKTYDKITNINTNCKTIKSKSFPNVKLSNNTPEQSTKTKPTFKVKKQQIKVQQSIIPTIGKKLESIALISSLLQILFLFSLVLYMVWILLQTN